jgi:acyl CoA:acetate/3-ketoacid CoA transferase
VTERAVFRLAEQGIELVEVAPGIDMTKDVLGRMPFAPTVRCVRAMPALGEPCRKQSQMDSHTFGRARLLPSREKSGSSD